MGWKEQSDEIVGGGMLSEEQIRILNFIIVHDVAVLETDPCSGLRSVE